MGLLINFYFISLNIHYLIKNKKKKRREGKNSKKCHFLLEPKKND